MQVMVPSTVSVKRPSCHFKSLQIIDDTLNTTER